MVTVRDRVACLECAIRLGLIVKDDEEDHDG